MKLTKAKLKQLIKEQLPSAITAAEKKAAEIPPVEKKIGRVKVSGKVEPDTRTATVGASGRRGGIAGTVSRGDDKSASVIGRYEKGGTKVTGETGTGGHSATVATKTGGFTGKATTGTGGRHGIKGKIQKGGLRASGQTGRAVGGTRGKVTYTKKGFTGHAGYGKGRGAEYGAKFKKGPVRAAIATGPDVKRAEGGVKLGPLDVAAFYEKDKEFDEERKGFTAKYGTKEGPLTADVGRTVTDEGDETTAGVQYAGDKGAGGLRYTKDPYSTSTEADVEVPVGKGTIMARGARRTEEEGPTTYEAGLEGEYGRWGGRYGYGTDTGHEGAIRYQGDKLGVEAGYGEDTGFFGRGTYRADPNAQLYAQYQQKTAKGGGPAGGIGLKGTFREALYKGKHKNNMKLTKAKLKQLIREKLDKRLLSEAKYKVGDSVKHDSEDLGTGKVIAVEPGKKGNILVRWKSGTKKHHRWALKPAEK